MLKKSGKVVIVGAGISGLTVAYRLRQLGIEAQVLEASTHIGGLIRTEHNGGFLIEHGPESILQAKPAGRQLALELGLEDEIQQTRGHVGGAYILQRGKLIRIPEGFSLMAPANLRHFLVSPLFSWPAKLRVLAEPWVPARTSDEDESLASFVRRRLGGEVLDRVAQPMVSGIYGADPETLSLAASMPRFVELERQYGSLLRGLRRQREQNKGAAGARYKLFFSFRHGMQTLTDALAARCPTIETSTHVRSVHRGQTAAWRVATDKKTYDADSVVLAVPAPVAAKLLVDIDPELYETLQTIGYGRGAAISLAYDRRAIAHPLDAYGFVVPSVERTGVIACTFLHQKWGGRAPAGKALLRAFVVDQTSNKSDDELVRLAHDELASWLKIREMPLRQWVTRFVPSTPHYTLGHQARVGAIFERLEQMPGLRLVGNAFRGVGIPDSISLAEQTARTLVKNL